MHKSGKGMAAPWSSSSGGGRAEPAAAAHQPRARKPRSCLCRLGTAAAGAAAGPAPAAADGWAAGRDVGREEGAVDRYLAGIRVYVDTRASECCATAGLEEASRQAAGSGAAAAEVGLPPPPAGASEAGLAPVWAALETSLKTVSGGGLLPGTVRNCQEQPRG